MRAAQPYYGNGSTPHTPMRRHGNRLEKGKWRALDDRTESLSYNQRLRSGRLVAIFVNGPRLEPACLDINLRAYSKASENRLKRVRPVIKCNFAITTKPWALN